MTGSRHIPRGERTNPHTPRSTLLDRSPSCQPFEFTPTDAAHTKRPADTATQDNLKPDTTRPQAEARRPRTPAIRIPTIGPPRSQANRPRESRETGHQNPRVAASTTSRQVANTHPYQTAAPALALRLGAALANANARLASSKGPRP